MFTIKPSTLTLLLFTTLLILSVLSLFVGVIDIRPAALLTGDTELLEVFLISRLPRLLAILCTGVGMSATGRVGPGTDDAGNPVYSFNVVFCSAAFEEDGRIAQVMFDQLEVATPNYDGSSMPHFSGFPGQGGYALWDDAQGKTNGTTEDTEENFLAEVSAWTTKRERGNDYKLNTATWSQEMDTFQQLFVGKTVDEVDAWFEKYCSDVNGRPLTAESAQEGDQEKYAALTDEEKQQLADVTSSATMSLKDNHGDLLAALRKAWEMAQK